MKKIALENKPGTSRNIPAAFPHIHAVTDAAAVCRSDFVAIAGRAMTEIKSRLAIHLRAPMIPAKMFFELALKLAELQRETGAWLIVNDRVDVAVCVGAKGIQLTSRSLSVEDARKVAPGIPVGASVHSVDEATAAAAAGAAWCVAGNVFATETHPGALPKRSEFISAVAGAVSIPVIAIGGINPEQLSALLDAGAYGVATIRGAGWTGEAVQSRDDPMNTVLIGRACSSPGTPLSNYIWEYDAHRARAQRDLPDGQRDATRIPI